MISVNKLTKIYRTPVNSGNFIQDVFHRTYKEHHALHKISFDIGENELVGFIGPNGAGKTTTMKILSGILYPTSGTVSVLGYTPFDKQKDFLKQIGFLMGQKNQLLWELPAIDSFELNRAIYEIDRKEYEKTKNELVELLDAQSLINQPVKTLSLGQRMRVELISSLLHKPKILFLDEPTIGLDIFAQTTIIDFIKQYQEKYKATIMLTSHYMQDVQRLANRIIMINKGEIIHDGKFDEMVTKYSDKKIITIILAQHPARTHFTGFDFTLDFPKLTIHLSKEELTEKISYILKNVDFTDLSIEDEPLEDIIKRIFKDRSPRGNQL